MKIFKTSLICCCCWHTESKIKNELYFSQSRLSDKSSATQSQKKAYVLKWHAHDCKHARAPTAASQPHQNAASIPDGDIRHHPVLSSIPVYL